MSIEGIFLFGVVCGGILGVCGAGFFKPLPLLARLCLALASVSGVICLFNEMEKTI